MKNLIQKKLSSFIVPIAIGSMLFSFTANAQIVYTDVNPDISKTCTSVSSPCSNQDSIDLNNDGIFDLKLLVTAAPTGQQSNPPPRRGYVRVSPLNGSAVKTDTSGNPLAMNLNDVIDSNGNWITTSNQVLISRRSPNGSGPAVIGNWLSSTDKYLGLKIISGSQTNYCWVRLSVGVVPLFDSLIAFYRLKDYAYNSIPNQPILSGQTTATGITGNFSASSISLYPNPATNHLTMALGDNIKKVEVTITDITGKIIYSTTASDTQKIEVNTKDFAAGIYVVRIQTADFIGTKKLMVEK